MDVAFFRKLFVHRDDVFALQHKDGTSYAPQRRVLTDRNIEDHLAGKQTIGLYQLKSTEDEKDWTVKWVCFDVDLNKEIWSKSDFKIEDWVERLSEQAQIIKDKLKKYGIPSYIEDSAGKGRHVWIFFNDPISARIVKKACERLLTTVPLIDKNMHIELFPKQESAELGNLVKAPLGRHMRTGNMSYFTEPLDDLEFVTEKDLEQANDPLEAIFLQCRAFSDLREKGLKTGHLTHLERQDMLYVFANLPGGTEYFTREILEKMNDYDSVKSQKYIDFTTKKGYKPITCSTLQSFEHESICMQQCRAIRNSDSPISFYYRALGEEQETKEINAVNRTDAYHQIGFGYYADPPSHYKDRRKLQMSDFYYRQDETLYIDDGLKTKKVFRGVLINKEGEHEFELTSDEWSSKEKLTAKVYGALGNNIFIDDIGSIRDAMNKFAGGKTTYVRKIFGYNQAYDRYYTPSVAISKDQIKTNDEVVVDLANEGSASFLDMKTLADHDFEFTKKLITDHLLKLLPSHVTHSAIAHALLPVMTPFLFKEADDSRYIFFVQGSSGAGKSFLMEKLQSLYGNYEYYGNWSGTPNSIQRIGWFYKDALYLVDDFKRKNVGKHYNEALTLMQTYTDNAGRTRLNVDSSLQQTYRIQGWLTMAGEDHVEGEASNVARMVVVQVGNVPKNLKSGAVLSKFSHMLSGFTPRYIQWIMNQDAEEMRQKLLKYHEHFHEPIKAKDNGVRISRNVALLLLSFDYVARFLWSEKEALKYIQIEKNYLEQLIFDMVDSAIQESSADRFWTTLLELLATGKVRFQMGPNEDPDSGTRITIIGFTNGAENCLILKTAYQEVQKALKNDIMLGHSAKAIALELWKKDIFKDKSTVVRRLNRKAVRVIRINQDEFEKLKEENNK